VSDFNIIEDDEAIVKNATRLAMIVNFDIGRCVSSNTTTFPCKCIIAMCILSEYAKSSMHTCTMIYKVEHAIHKTTYGSIGLKECFDITETIYNTG